MGRLRLSNVLSVLGISIALVLGGWFAWEYFKLVRFEAQLTGPWMFFAGVHARDCSERDQVAAMALKQDPRTATRKLAKMSCCDRQQQPGPWSSVWLDSDAGLVYFVDIRDVPSGGVEARVVQGK